jgi:molecular chaperone HtpG
MTTLVTQAEQFAKEACELPEFRNLNITGIKDQVAEILDMIGRVEGLFSTYTKHDISHINAMLGMLDWLVPPTTKEAMSPTDWLMIVLAIYFHDLGMVVTSDEYKKRTENEEFQQFLDKLQKDPDAKDYLARAEAMTLGERDRFFYQEFVRLHHASRIREWIMNRPSRFWGESLTPLTEEITRIMADVPIRFREHLAVVCESHHKDDLNRTDLYPLAQRYGTHQSEIVNVQYAALLLTAACSAVEPTHLTVR